MTIFIDRPLWPARGRMWSHYEPALRLGAEPVGSQDLVARLIRAGLRRRKHRPEG